MEIEGWTHQCHVDLSMNLNIQKKSVVHLVSPPELAHLHLVHNADLYVI